MFRSVIRSTLLAAVLAMPVAASAQTMVREVEVTMDITAITNPQAAAYWTRTADDLENAIVARLVDRTDPEDGAKVSVDIDELELANSFQSVTNMADARLAGQVNVYSDTANNALKAYTLAITVDQAVLFLPEGTDIAALASDSPLYYEALINAFADSVVTNLN
jgi:uncharacterized surface anchored protein